MLPQYAHDDLRAPLVWEPEWRVYIGPVIDTGHGLLSPRVWRQRHLIETFTVYIAPTHTTACVDLRTGLFLINGSTVQHMAVDPAVHPRLIWYRRMRKEIAETDRSAAPFECAHYGLGWQATIAGRNIKVGYVIDSSGQLTEGLPDSAPT